MKSDEKEIISENDVTEYDNNIFDIDGEKCNVERRRK